MTEMTITQTPLKRCSNKDLCVNPLGQYLPATHEYFAYGNTEKCILKSRCKACASKYARERGMMSDVKERRRANRDVAAENKSRSIRRALDPEYRAHQNELMTSRREQLGIEWRAQDNEYKRQERDSHPEKPRARDAVKRAIKTGVLPVVNSLPCADCGMQAEHYHHPDYSKPLEVVALCKFCHGARHRRNQ